VAFTFAAHAVDSRRQKRRHAKVTPAKAGTTGETACPTRVGDNMRNVDTPDVGMNADVAGLKARETHSADDEMKFRHECSSVKFRLTQ
jgi:hypothetical protein